MTSSYQHSVPGQHDLDLASADENDPLFANQVTNQRHYIAKNKRLVGVLILGVVMVLALVNSGSNTPSSTSLLQSDSMPDYNDKQGQYDWQKCKESNDPDCWKNEGKRVGNWWSNFGQRMKAWWSGLFGKKESGEEPTAAPKEKAKKSKPKPTEAPPPPPPPPPKEPKAPPPPPATEAPPPKEPKPTVDAVEEKPKS